MAHCRHGRIVPGQRGRRAPCIEVWALALTLHGIQPSNVFRLGGADENSATSALGWVLEQSPTYRNLVIEATFGGLLDSGDAVISLQRHHENGGYTDLEIQLGRQFHAILEAKHGWEVASEEQFQRYVPRLIAAAADRKRLVSVSAADRDYAGRRLPAGLKGIAIVHLSWGELARLCKLAQPVASRFEEKLWLRQWALHLQEFVSMERQIDNTVFVVSLSSRPMIPGQTHTWIDVVEKDKCYFHPVGRNWPVQPPNYVGFRYYGRLQSVHHIDSFEIVEDLATRNRSWANTDFDHFVYHLGPPMRPLQEIKTGNIPRNARVWCAIDTLLSGAFATISDARDETKRRQGELA
jgi:hypothetical protein